MFLAPELAPTGGGGGGGGNQQPGPIRRAQGVGADPMTLRVGKNSRHHSPAHDSRRCRRDVPPLPSIVLDAQPLASGLFEQIGLPTGGVVTGTSTGPGSGGGVGTGSGTGTARDVGLDSDLDPAAALEVAFTAPGGSVSAPRLIKETKPKYTSEALRNGIQGTVVLETIVTADGCASRNADRPVRWTQAVSIKKPSRPSPSGGSSLDGLEPRRSTCSSRSRSTS